MEERTIKERQMEGERREKQKIELIHKLEAHNQAMNGSLIGVGRIEAGVGRTEAQGKHNPLLAQMRVGAAIPIVPPLSDHASEIRGLKEELQNVRSSFDKFAQGVIDRLAILEMKVGS